MKNNANNTPQISLILRLLCGGYLVYTAWDLRDAFQKGPHFIVFAIIFAVIGLVLAGHSLMQLWKEFSVDKTEATLAEDNESNDSEEQSDE